MKKHTKASLILSVLICTCLLITSLIAGTVAAEDWNPEEMCNPWEEWEYCELEFNTGTAWAVCGNWVIAQPFTAVESHAVNMVDLRLYQDEGPDPDDYLMVCIYNTDGTYKPTGEALGCGGMFASEITATSHPGEWVGTSIDEVWLEEGITYAIVIWLEADCPGNISWCGSGTYTSNPHPLPAHYYSDDRGASWDSQCERMAFRLAYCGDEEEVHFIPPPPTTQPKPFVGADSSWAEPPAQTLARPANTSVLTASVQPSQVTAGQPVTIMANVKNNGDLSDSFNAELTINGQLEASKQVNVPGNGAVPVEFAVVKDEPGTYTIDIGGQKAYFTVVGNATKDVSSTSTIAYMVLGLLAMLAVALGIVFAMRKGFAR